ncbi:MAG: hypothetical protein R3217_10715 [Gammaproteobacteria bacterium]|nr:hypothetical protein [Gammaproteobacteria bacterium]
MNIVTLGNRLLVFGGLLMFLLLIVGCTNRYYVASDQKLDPAASYEGRLWLVEACSFDFGHRLTINNGIVTRTEYSEVIGAHRFCLDRDAVELPRAGRSLDIICNDTCEAQLRDDSDDRILERFPIPEGRLLDFTVSCDESQLFMLLRRVPEEGIGNGGILGPVGHGSYEFDVHLAAMDLEGNSLGEIQIGERVSNPSPRLQARCN